MKKFIRWLVYTAVITCFLVISLIATIDRTPLSEQPFYHAMMTEMDTLRPFISKPKHRLKASWGKYNITPSTDMPMAGYKPRDHFDSVHDSLFARVLAIDNGQLSFIISVDLLLFPPVIKKQIEDGVKKKLPNAFLYFSATHTHNGVGGWNDSFAGQLIAGDYQQEWVDEVSLGIVNTLLTLSEEMMDGSVSFFEADASGYAVNRLAGTDGKVDSKLRGIKITRQDSSKAILVSFSAHATSISKTINKLSGDYPSELEKELERNGYDFSMYLAGMVGSHALDGFTEQNFELTEKAGKTLAAKILNESIETAAADSISITTAHIPIRFGDSQLRLEKNLRVRDWAFRSLFGELKGELTLLEIGNIILIGTPCDFSGEISVIAELDKLASAHGKKLIITSFNGDYIGYITLDEHYDRYKKEEVMALNWVGPNYGKYFEKIINRILTER